MLTIKDIAGCIEGYSGEKEALVKSAGIDAKGKWRISVTPLGDWSGRNFALYLVRQLNGYGDKGFLPTLIEKDSGVNGDDADIWQVEAVEYDKKAKE